MAGGDVNGDVNGGWIGHRKWSGGGEQWPPEVVVIGGEGYWDGGFGGVRLWFEGHRKWWSGGVG